MPTYNFRNKETGEEYSEMMSISALDKYLSDNPHIEQMLSTPSILYNGTGDIINKTPDGYKDLLKQIKKNNRRSTIEV